MEVQPHLRVRKILFKFSVEKKLKNSKLVVENKKKSKINKRVYIFPFSGHFF